VALGAAGYFAAVAGLGVYPAREALARLRPRARSAKPRP
jgi:hypothetical protein